MSNNTLKLLLVHDHVDEADRLASLLRNASYKVSPKHVESEKDLPQLLQNNSWDLILAQYECTAVSMQAILHNTPPSQPRYSGSEYQRRPDSNPGRRFAPGSFRCSGY